MKKIVSALLSLCLLCTGLLPAFAAEDAAAYIIAEQKTEIPAVWVYCMEGYASVLIENLPLTAAEKKAKEAELRQEYSDFQKAVSPDEDAPKTFEEFLEMTRGVKTLDAYFGNYVQDFAVSLVAAPDGTLIMPGVRNPGNHESINRHYISDGIISLNVISNWMPVEKDDKNGYFDLTGKRVIPEIYNSGSPFFNGYAFVRDCETVTETDEDGDTYEKRVVSAYLIDKTGKVVLDLSDNFGQINGYGDGPGGLGAAMVGSCGGYGEGLIGFSHGYQLEGNVKNKKTWGDQPAYNLAGYMDLNGNIVIPQKYYETYPFNGGMAAVREAEVKTIYSYWDSTLPERIEVDSVELMPEEYRESMMENTEAVPGKWGYIDKEDHTVIPFIYDTAASFSGDYAVVSKDGKYGVIDRKNNTVVPFTEAVIYDSVDNGLYVSVDAAGASVKTLAGEAVWSIAAGEYEDISGIQNGIFYYVKDGKLNAVSVSLPQMKGDLNGDEKVNAADARLALRAAVSLEHYIKGSAVFLAADINGDGKISAADARLILRAAVGLEKIA